VTGVERGHDEKEGCPSFSQQGSGDSQGIALPDDCKMRGHIVSLSAHVEVLGEWQKELMDGGQGKFERNPLPEWEPASERDLA